MLLPLLWSYDDSLRKGDDILPDQDSSDKRPRVHKKGHLKAHKAEARERTYTQNLYAYALRIEGHPRFSYLVIDAND